MSKTVWDRDLVPIVH